MDIGEGIGKRRVDKGGVGSNRRNRGRVGEKHVKTFERELIGRKWMREKIWKDGVFYSWQGQPLNFLDPIQEPKSLLQLNIPPLDQERMVSRGTSVVYNFLNFIFFFFDDKVRWWDQEVQSVYIIFVIG